MPVGRCFLAGDPACADFIDQVLQKRQFRIRDADSQAPVFTNVMPCKGYGSLSIYETGNVGGDGRLQQSNCPVVTHSES